MAIFFFFFGKRRRVLSQLSLWKATCVGDLNSQPFERKCKQLEKKRGENKNAHGYALGGVFLRTCRGSESQCAATATPQTRRENNSYQKAYIEKKKNMESAQGMSIQETTAIVHLE